jgi:protein-S-isoprenylcysteine O-methyltransferase Ste14
MSWIPVFQIGLWNAWILMLYFPLIQSIMIIIDKAIGTGEIMKKMGTLPTNKRERRANSISTYIMFLLIVFSVFLPLKLGTLWFYAGLAIYLSGLVIFITTIINIAPIPLGKPYTQGTYRYSRHPLYFSINIIHLGVSLATASWVFLLISFVFMYLIASHVAGEERVCLDTFGEEYHAYLNRTPRWIGLPKSK